MSEPAIKTKDIPQPQNEAPNSSLIELVKLLAREAAERDYKILGLKVILWMIVKGNYRPLRSF